MTEPTRTASPRDVLLLLRLEGLAVFAVALTLYARADASWWLFALLVLAPDLSMVGYLKDERIGARVYNAVHTYLGPALLGAAAWWLGSALAGHVALIWVVHIGFDRLLGFGLKHPTGFGDTHLERIDRAR